MNRRSFIQIATGFVAGIVGAFAPVKKPRYKYLYGKAPPTQKVKWSGVSDKADRWIIEDPPSKGLKWRKLADKEPGPPYKTNCYFESGKVEKRVGYRVVDPLCRDVIINKSDIDRIVNTISENCYNSPSEALKHASMKNVKISKEGHIVKA